MRENNLLISVFQEDKIDRPPVWLMRQAGRILPEYRELRSKLKGFKELVRTPHLAAEVTAQPVDILGVDAAILFSDILVIPEAMGQSYHMEKGVGPVMDDVISGKESVEKLISGDDAADNLIYVYDAIDHTVKELDDRVPLVGFAGAPWTLMAYMLEGQGSKKFSKARRLLYQDPILAHKLLDKITSTIISYLNRKREHGCDMLQLFDSWVGLLNEDLFAKFCFPYLKRITLEVEGPLVYFPKGGSFALHQIARLEFDGISVDWMQNIGKTREILGDHIVLQGNLDPCLLYSKADKIEAEVKRLHRVVPDKHIFNLGHGVYPDTPLEGVKAFINAVKEL